MRTLGSRYVLHELLGQGTTGEVWRASRRDDGAEVAVKMLRPEFADDPVVVDRFLREWQILYDIDSPDLVRVLDLVNERDALAIVMELVEGTDLREYLRREAPLPVERAARIVIDVLWALDTVHGAGVVHRDVKPENVLLDERRGGPAVRLTDFGIARMVDSLSRGRATATGPIGTPLYMAPELGDGAAPTPAADIYSAGIVLYELLSGVPPFDEANPTDLLRAHREEQPLPIKGVSRPVWDVLSAMLEKSPSRRPPSAADAARALEDALRRDRDRDRDDDRDHDRRRGEDTWDRDPIGREDTNDTLGDLNRRSVAMAGAGVGAAGAVGMTKAAQSQAAHAQAGYGPGGGHGPGRGGYPEDWNDAATGLVPPARGPRDGDRWDDDPATNMMPVVGGPNGPGGPGGPRGGPRWDDEAATGLAPAIGGPGGPRDDYWDDDEDPPTGAQEVRVPGRAGPTRSDRNTLVPSSRPVVPTPGGGGGRPPVQDSRQRMRIAAGAALVVALIAGAGGWALAAAGGDETNNSTGTQTTTSDGATSSSDPGVTYDPSATEAYVTTNPTTGETYTVSPTPKPGTSASTRPSATASNTDGSAPTTTTPAPTTPTSAVVPDVRNMTVAQAKSRIQNAGFPEPSANAKCYSEDTAVNQVQGQSPSGGTRADLSTVVSLDYATDCATVPDVRGQPGNQAMTTINNAGFSAQAAFGVPWSCNDGYNNVTAQSPTGRQPKGTWIYLTYTCKPPPPPETTPPPAS
ncbi:serine/threonine protein kinase [Frankia nepalensis]|uniref:non-specific serine/threonine protein kinase n=1 Tax=Frankia nepalensis TaxID=1836974 RepID=A0A937RLF6_9ACTN|nr:serine/threonine-protein kinase [Frankia nepalensis]MBL7494931.1 protein kinase [Frankia nepalensis]MBL7510541.1 protein kinase [Frankia nepalensis]MBL7629484.1 protein kinase [Frankia nepalensis]